MQLSLNFSLKKIIKYLIRLLFFLSVFWYFCRPTVVVHYSADAANEIAYFFLEDNYTTKSTIKPGERLRFYTKMLPEPNELLDFSLPFTGNRDGIEIHPPFSRIDIYIDSSARIERMNITQNFFARFYDPKQE